MRKWNAILSMVIVVLFLFHAVAGGFQLMGFIPGGSGLLTRIAWVLLGGILVHMLMGIKLTWDTLRACRKSGVSYFKENGLFWARRISGFAILILMIFHIILFMGRESGGVYRLNPFGVVTLALQILLVAAIAIHVITNVKPSWIGLGLKGGKQYALDICIILSVLLVFMGAAFFVYYLRWQ